MPYIPDWESLRAAVNRLMAFNVEESEAKSDLCHAIADRKVSVRVALRDGKGVFLGGNVRPPLHLEPRDLDWDNSRPQAPWAIGPMPGQHYGWLDDWEKKPIDRVEVSTADVLETLCAGLRPLGVNELKHKAVQDAFKRKEPRGAGQVQPEMGADAKAAFKEIEQLRAQKARERKLPIHIIKRIVVQEVSAGLAVADPGTSIMAVAKQKMTAINEQLAHERARYNLPVRTHYSKPDSIYRAYMAASKSDS